MQQHGLCRSWKARSRAPYSPELDAGAPCAGDWRKHIGHIERGSRKASIDTLVMLANAMKISTDELLGGSLSMPNDLVMPVKNLTKGQKQAMMQILTTAQEQVLQWNTPDE